MSDLSPEPDPQPTANPSGAAEPTADDLGKTGGEQIEQGEPL